MPRCAKRIRLTPEELLFARQFSRWTETCYDRGYIIVRERQLPILKRIPLFRRDFYVGPRNREHDLVPLVLLDGPAYEIRWKSELRGGVRPR